MTLTRRGRTAVLLALAFAVALGGQLLGPDERVEWTPAVERVLP